VGVVHRPDEEIDEGIGGERFNKGGIGGADPFALKTNEDLDLAGILGAQAMGFNQIGLVSLEEGADGVAGFNLVMLLEAGRFNPSRCALGLRIYLQSSTKEQTYALLRGTNLDLRCGVYAQSMR